MKVPLDDRRVALHEESFLVLRAQLGDRPALEELLRRTQPWLGAYLRRLTAEPGLAEEVGQEVLLTLSRKLPLLHEPRAYRTWVYRIASRRAGRASRRWRRRRDTEGTPLAEAPESPSPPPSAELLDREAATTLRRRVSELPPAARVVVVLHYFEELTLRRVGEILGLSEGTVKSRLAYGLERLRSASKPNRAAP